jgi:hypothetical protein
VSHPRTFSTYRAVYEALRRAKIEHPGKTAWILLEAFVNGSNKIYAANVMKAGLCQKGAFDLWRTQLCQKGWLVFELIEGKYPRYKPGPKLVKYVNKERSSQKTMATLDEVQNIEIRVEKAEELILQTKDELKEEIKILKKALSKLIDQYDPPATDDKIQRHLNIIKEKNQ